MESTQFEKNHPPPPVSYQEQESLNLIARQKQIDRGAFPRIIDVFSLNPSLPAKYFQDNVAVRLTPGGLIESVGRRSLENVVPNQNAIPGHSFNRWPENPQEKRNLVDYDKKCMQGDNFQMNQRADILDYIDIEAGLNVTKIGLTEGKPHAIEMHDGCEFQDNSTKEEIARDREAMVIVNKNDVLERISSDVNGRGKRRKRKRRAMFSLRRSKKRHLMGDLNTVKEKNQRELENELIRDGTKIDQSLQVEGCSSLKDANTGSEDISTDERSNSSEKQGQEKAKDGSIQSKQNGEKNTTISFAGQTDFKSADTIDGENLKDTSVSSLHGYNIRQSKIRDLKEKLAKQEQEIRNLKQRRDLENVGKEDCASDARPVEDNGSALLKYETIFDFSHPIDVTLSAQNEENDDDCNLGKIEDLIDTFQKEIKSFRILDTELYPTGRHADYDHLQTKSYVIGGSYKHVFTGVNNQMRLALEDFAGKEDFLFQLGLLRM